MSDKKLYYLNDLSNYKVDSDYPDVRGWQLKDKSGNVLGKIDNLLVNKEAKRVVYLDIEANEDLLTKDETLSTSASDGVHGFVNKEGDNHLIVPIGMVDIDEENESVYSDSIDMDKFKQARRYKKGKEITPEYELDLFVFYTGDKEASTVDESFYDRKEFHQKRRM